MSKNIFIIVMLSASVFIASCQPTAAQIEAEGTSYAMRVQADIDRQKADQQRVFDQELFLYEKQLAEADVVAKEALYAVWTPRVAKFGNFVLALAYVVSFVVAIALAFTSGFAIPELGRIAMFFLWVRAGVVPIDNKTRQPRMLISPEVENLSPSNNPLLGFVQETWNMNVTRVHPNKWIVRDPSTGMVMAKYHEDRAPYGQALEVNRQRVNLWLLANAMKSSSLFGFGDGKVAESIASVHAEVPGSQVDFDESKFEATLSEIVKMVKK